VALPIVWCVIELKDNQPKWRQIAKILAGRIVDGTYAPGTKIPTVLEIVGEFKVANRTAQKAVQALRDEGLIYTEYGMGSFVVEKEEAPDQD
jgi:GntR family transcriptional regulator